MNEREFIARVEAANTEELIQILSLPSSGEDRVLHLHPSFWWDDFFRYSKLLP